MTERPHIDRVREELVLRHRGREKGVSGEALAARLGMSERELRRAVKALRNAGVPISAHPSTGYYYGIAPEELKDTCAFLHSRALSSLRQESRLSGAPLAELLGQLRLELEEGA